MVQLASEKSSIAWFKLAECVGRKEKERALLMLRLLVHALSDKAYAAQLEGDLLWAFKDERALDAYRRAIALYEETQRIKEAFELYEKLVLIMEFQSHYFSNMIQRYHQWGYDAQTARCIARCVSLLIDDGQYDRAQQLYAECKFLPVECAGIHAAFVFALLKKNNSALCEQREYHMQQALEGFLHDVGGKCLTAFLVRLSCVDQSLHQRALELLDKTCLDKTRLDTISHNKKNYDTQVL